MILAETKIPIKQILFSYFIIFMYFFAEKYKSLNKLVTLSCSLEECLVQKNYLLSEEMNGSVCQICDMLDIIGGQWYHYNFCPLFCKYCPGLHEFCLFQVARRLKTLTYSPSEQWCLEFSTHQNHLISSGVKPRICIFNKHLTGTGAHGPCFKKCYYQVRCLHKCYNILLYHLEFQ